jgi:hypothetical protein
LVIRIAIAVTSLLGAVMPGWGQRGAVAGAAVLVGTATAVVTNLITTKWSVGLAAGLGVLLVVGVALQVVLARREDPAGSGDEAGAPAGPVIRQDARARGRATIIQAGGDVGVKLQGGPGSSQEKRKPAG